MHCSLFAKLLRLVGLVALSAAVGSVPVAAHAEEHAGWTAALEAKGPFAYLRDWYFNDDNIGRGVVNSRYFRDIMAGSKPFALPLYQDALHLGDDENTLKSTACVPAWGCDNLTPTLETLALHRQAATTAMVTQFIDDAPVYQKNGTTQRALLIRVLGWTGDKSVVPLVLKIAAYDSGEFTNDAIEAAAGLLGLWRDKSLVPTCQAAFSPDRNDEYQIDRVRTTCVWYLQRVADQTTGRKIARAHTGSQGLDSVAAATLGDFSDKAQWQATAKELAKIGGNPDYVKALIGLALAGDKAAEKRIVDALTGSDDDAQRTQALHLQAYVETELGKRVLSASKRAIGKLPVVGFLGQTKALLVAMAARQGDATMVKEIKALFGSNDDEVRRVLAMALGIGNYAGILELPRSGIAGGAPLPGLMAVLAAAHVEESDKVIRGFIARAWAMTLVAGGT